MKAQDLKNTILQLAVQGKLVEQDPNDEPASVLLERIREERAELVKQKKVKAPKGGESIIYREGGSWYECRGKSDPVCIDEEIPFEIPDGWEWTRLEAVLSLASGLGYKKPDLAVKGDCMIRVYRGGNIGLGDNPAPKDNDIMISSEFVDDSLILHDGQIITPAVTSLENVGKAAFIKGADGKTVCGGFVFYLTPQLEDSTLSEYLFRYLSSPSHVGYCKANVKKSGQAFYNLSKAALNKALVPIPPLAEQRRIVARIDELMPLVEDYGRLEDAREALDAALPERLRKSVLQMAVQGKLVAQDPADEPASMLLERIREERAKLIREKKIKAPKGGESVIYRSSDGGHYEKRGSGEPVCIDEEIPFDIPESWEWARLESVTIYIQRGRTPKYSPVKKYPVVAQKCNQWSGFSIEKAKFIDPETVNKYAEERILLDGDLMWNSTGLGTLGRMAIYYSELNSYGWAVADSHVTVIRTVPAWLNHRYVFSYFAGPSVQRVIEDQASGSTKQKELAQETVKSYLLPIPPLAEQQRIVERVDEILSLIEG